LFRRIAIGTLLLVGLVASIVGVAWLARFQILRWREGLPAFTHSAGELRRVMIDTRDGVGLATHVFLPAGEGPWPTLLVRNPYAGFDVMVRSWCGMFVRYGYACVYQDVRGQGDSQGEWEPLEHETSDGLATLAWLVQQDFQDKHIALFGPSYLAVTQWAVAAGLPPEVKTFIPSVNSTRLRETLYESGMFRLETFTAWAAMMPERGMRTGMGEAYQSALHHRPHVEVDERFFGVRLPWYREWVRSPARSAALWQRPAYRQLERTPEITHLPVLFVSGWYDVFFGPQMDDWQRLASKTDSRFVVGPWTHAGMNTGVLDTPGAGGGLMQWSLVLDWLGHHLRGEELENGPGVATYVMGERRWRERASWPPASEPRRLYLGQAADAKSCRGGRLTQAPPEAGSIGRYVYDPDAPVPTRGGGGMLAFLLPGIDGAPAANVWQDDLCDREDILSFVSEPLEASWHLAGTPRVRLSVRSSAPDTAFTAKLVEVFEDGRPVNVRDGIASLAYRDGSGEPETYTPGEAVAIDVRLWPIEWAFAKGSRIRLDVSSSDFPKYNAHSNRAGLWSEQTSADTASQEVLTGPGFEAWVELPIVSPQAHPQTEEAS